MSVSGNALPEIRRNELVPYALAGIVGAAIVIVFGNTNVDHAAGESGGLGPALITGIVCLVLAGVLFGVVLRRFYGTRTGIVLAVLAVLSLIAFWSGITPVLGAAAAAIGRRSSGSFTVTGWVGIVAGAIAVVWAVVAHFA